jgi:hypothetical protein
MRVKKSWVMGFITVSMIGLVGCGGGTEKAKITQESVDTMGKNAAAVLPGCEYNSDNAIAVRMDDELAGAYLLLYKKVDTLKTNNRTKKLGRTINESKAGTCGGTYHKDGTHENGIEDVTYTYDHYCTGEPTKKTVMTGVVTVHSDSTPTPSGPELNYMTVSTGTDGLVTEATAGGTTQKQTIELSNLKYVVGKNGGSSQITADRLKTVSDGKVYEVTDLNIEFAGDVDGGALTVNSATYTDPDVGAVSISTTPLQYGDGATGAGAVTLTGKDGSVEFKTNDVSTMKFTAYLDGEPAGSIDCSRINAE